MEDIIKKQESKNAIADLRKLLFVPDRCTDDDVLRMAKQTEQDLYWNERDYRSQRVEFARLIAKVLDGK